MSDTVAPVVVARGAVRRSGRIATMGDVSWIRVARRGRRAGERLSMLATRGPAVRVRVREPGSVRGGVTCLVVEATYAPAVRVVAAVGDEVGDRPELRRQQEYKEQDGTSRLSYVPDCRAALPHVVLRQDDGRKHER